jgi:NDP-sugar pyrophosphorylase family protein
VKVVILAGGLGSRLAEETELKPKPMVEIGGRPTFRHIMKGIPIAIRDLAMLVGRRIGHQKQMMSRDALRMLSNPGAA